MIDPDLFRDPEAGAPSHYWALLAWLIALCAIIGLATYAMGTVQP